MIPYGKHEISKQDIEAVVAVLESDYLTTGPEVKAFEEAMREKCGARYAVAVNSATSALHMACEALGVRGKTVWTVPLTFVASANSALNAGAQIDFVDVDSQTLNVCIDALELKLRDSAKKNTLPTVLIPVHFAGLPCDMKRVGEICEKYGVRVVEDASHALGASENENPVGSCQSSDIAVFSFHPVKNVACGEGGMALTNDEDLYERMLRFRTHGITRNEKDFVGVADGPWSYQQVELGFNYRLSDIHAALGRSQLKRLERFIEQRRDHAFYYRGRFEGCGLALQEAENLGDSAWHIFTITLPDNVDRKQAYQTLVDAGIGANVHYKPVHLQPYYMQQGFSAGAFPNAEKYYSKSLTIPLYPSLSKKQRCYVADTTLGMLK